jgi:hypothetical protein
MEPADTGKTVGEVLRSHVKFKVHKIMNDYVPGLVYKLVSCMQFLVAAIVSSMTRFNSIQFNSIFII